MRNRDDLKSIFVSNGAPPTTLAAESRRYYNTMLPNNEDPKDPQDSDQ